MVSAAPSGAPRPAGAQLAQRQTQRAGRQPNAAQLKCLQQAGASPDPVTKRWTFYTTERDGASRTDMFRLCLAGGDRVRAQTIPVREFPMNPGGSLPQR